jgi:hypothetical protein
VSKKYQPELPLFFPRKIRLTEKQFLIWFAAWLDTEGSIVLLGNGGYPNRYAQLTVYQKDVIPLKMIQAKLGGSILNQKFQTCLMFRWSLCGKKAVTLLKRMADYLVVKRAKAINVIQYYELKESGQATREVHEKYRALVNDGSKGRVYKSRVPKESEAKVN